MWAHSATIVLATILALGFSPCAYAVDDLLGGSPLDNTAPNMAFLDHPKQPSNFWGNLQGPYQTNSWWENLVLDNGDQPIMPLPYHMKTMDDGIHVCFPSKVIDASFVYESWVDNWIIKASEGLGSRAINKAGLLSVTMAWEAGLEAPIVQGMPYVTAKYQGLTPVLSTIHAILSVNGINDGSPISGTRFQLELNNGQTWLVYTSSDITFTKGDGVLTASGSFTGTLRLAELAAGVTIETLDGYSTAYPEGGSVTASSSGDDADLVFNWEKGGSGDLLMMALPHHIDVLTGATIISTSYNTIKGDMTGVIGETWTLKEKLTTTEWFAPNGIDSSKLDAIKSALNEDINTEIYATDPYFGGKQMARIARLAIIADEVGETALAETYREKVRPTLESWLEGTNVDPLIYDQTWGGVCSINGISDENADFGQGYYNDHHFHYGYHIYAAAVLARSDSAWADQHNDQIMHLIRDITEPSGADPYYTQTRSKDWYAGHSWANGIAVAFGDSHNQESTSESVHAWYAVYLYGLAVGNDRVKDLGRLQLATEIRGAQKYWQIMSQDDIYPEPFASNKVVGILWGSKVDYATWFGANVEFIHCIQMLPFVPTSEELLRQEWIQEEYSVLQSAFNTADEAWRGYIIMAHAIIDKEAAWNEASQLSSYDDGNTKSNTLYWIATRP